MKLQIHSIHFDADVKLLEFIEKRVSKLTTFYDQIIDGEVFLKLEKSEDPKKNKVTEIKLNLPGETLFAKDLHSSFEGATDNAVEGLRRQIKKVKEKRYVKRA